MIRITPPWILAVSILAAAGIALWYIREFRLGRKWICLPALLARLAAIFLLTWLLLLIFKERDPDESEVKTGLLPVWALLDESESMDLKEGASTRAKLAEEALAALRTQAKKARPAREVKVLRFARDARDPDVGAVAAASGSRTETRIGPVLARLLAEPHVGGVLVVSDGAFTDGPAHAAALQRLRNRGIPVMAELPLDQEAKRYDAAVRGLVVSPVNPRQALVTVSVVGVDDQKLPLKLTLDGKPLAERTLQIRGEEKAVFPLTDLAEGWHALEATLPAAPNDICPANNVRRAIFEVVRGDKVLFVHGRPNREDAEFARLLRGRYGERVQAWSVFEPPADPLAPEEFALVVLGGAPPDRVSPEVALLLRAASVRLLALGGWNLDRWRGLGQTAIPDYPAVPDPAAAPEKPPAPGKTEDPESWTLDEGGAGGPAGLVLPPAARRLPAPPTNPAVLAPGAAAVLMAEGSKSRRLFLVADRAEFPRIAVCLSPATWRWAVNPDPAVREGYHTFWGTVLEWLLRRRQDGADLDLTVEGPRRDTGRAILRARVRPGAGVPERCTLRLEGTGVAAPSLPLVWDRDKREFRGEFQCPGDGSIVWIQASGVVGGRELASRRRPLLWTRDDSELLDTRPRPDLLAALVRDPKSDTGWSNARETLAQQLIAAGKNLPMRRPPERDHALEVLLASLLFLLMGFEWWVERKLRD